jgi:hypothetical protein
MSRDGVPVLLTVEEAGVLLRIGRTKAYALAREWRETDGRSGLPVIDLGHVLRVPRQALEELIGADLATVTLESRVDEEPAMALPAGKPTHDKARPDVQEQTESVSRRRQRRSRQNQIANQLDFFDSKPRPD